MFVLVLKVAVEMPSQPERLFIIPRVFSFHVYNFDLGQVSLLAKCGHARAARFQDIPVNICSPILQFDHFLFIYHLHDTKI